MALRLAGGRDPRGAAGGSTLEMQLARSMWKQYRHNSNPLIRKIREWRAAEQAGGPMPEVGCETGEDAQ